MGSKTAQGVRLDYGYQANGLLKDVVSSTSQGVNIGYRYDDLNRLEHVDDASGAASTSVRTTDYTYNANGSLDSVSYANGIKHAYVYDTLNRLRTLTVSSVAGGVLHDYEYKLRPSGHRREVVEGARLTDYGYDALYRLTGEGVTGGGSSGPNRNISYELDKVGNRINRFSDLPAVAPQLGRSYNARDWLDGDSYDPNGNTVSGRLAPVSPGAAPERSINDVYDFENRLIVRQKADGTVINLAYDADGNRIGKTFFDSAGSLQRSSSYLVDTNNLTGYAQVLEEQTVETAGTQLTVYTYGSELIQSQRLVVSGTGTPASRYYLYDGGGSVRELADDSAAVTDSYDYDAFGVLVQHAGPSTNAYLYRGEQWDADLGLYYNRARYLNTDSGRFWSADSYEGRNTDPASMHKYLYAKGGPVMGFDPSGNVTLVEFMETAGVVGTLSLIANVGIFELGTWSASNGNWAPDAAIASVGLVGSTRGVSGAIGFDALYDFKSRHTFAYVGLSAGLAPLSYFKNFRNNLSPSVTAGWIWNLNSPNEWTEGGLTATIPWNLVKTFARVFGRGQNNPMWGVLTQLAKRETNPKWSDLVVQISLSTSGPVALKFGLRSNSFGTEASWAFDPVDLTALGTAAGELLSSVNLAGLPSLGSTPNLTALEHIIR